VNTYYAHDTGRTKGDRPKGPLDGAGRRSVYLEVRRNVSDPFLEVFDAPKPSTTRGERDVTNVPAQSLTLLNNPFAIDQAGRWADRVLAEPDLTPAVRIDRMFLRALGRAPSAFEHERAAELLAGLRAENAGSTAGESPAWRGLCEAMFNLKEFIYVR
jgi:Protein of unknown function (DUF1553)